MTMDLQNLQLQQQLHEQNQRRMSTMEEEQKRQGQLLVEILSNTASIPSLVERIDSLEGSRDKERGIIGFIALVWGGVEAFFHYRR